MPGVGPAAGGFEGPAYQRPWFVPQTKTRREYIPSRAVTHFRAAGGPEHEDLHRTSEPASIAEHTVHRISGSARVGQRGGGCRAGSARRPTRDRLTRARRYAPGWPASASAPPEPVRRGRNFRRTRTNLGSCPSPPATARRGASTARQRADAARRSGGPGSPGHFFALGRPLPAGPADFKLRLYRARRAGSPPELLALTRRRRLRASPAPGAAGLIPRRQQRGRRAAADPIRRACVRLGHQSSNSACS
jgi:hypothetical protein